MNTVISALRLLMARIRLRAVLATWWDEWFVIGLWPGLGLAFVWLGVLYQLGLLVFALFYLH